MRMKVVTCLTLALVATGVQAAEPATPGQRRSPEQAFEQMDRDANARIDLEEFRNRASRRFHRLDADGNGTLEAGEVPAWMQFPTEALPVSLEQWQDAIPARFAAIDANADGGIDRDELRAERERRDAAR